MYLTLSIFEVNKYYKRYRKKGADMSYQFIHHEDYAITKSKKRTNREEKAEREGKAKGIYKGDYNAESEGTDLRSIIAEAKREPGNIPSTVITVADPILLYGLDLDTVENMALDYHKNTKLKDKNGKEKKLRKDANVILAGVISLNREYEDMWGDYKNDSIKYLKEKYGDKLKSVVEHTDEAHPHFHFYVLQDQGEFFDLVHDGKKAAYEARSKNKLKGEQNTAYIKAMKAYQEDFFLNVASKYGLTKDGPKRARISRGDYFKQQEEIKLLNKLKQKTESELFLLKQKTEKEIKDLKQKSEDDIKKEKENAYALGRKIGKVEGFKSAVLDFKSKNYFNKVIFSKTFSENIIKKITDDNLKLKDKNKRLFARKEHYKKETEINNDYKIKYEKEKKKSDYLDIINDFIDKPKEENSNDIRTRIIREIEAVESQQQQLDQGSKIVRSRDNTNRGEIKRTNERNRGIKKMLFYNFRGFFRDFFSIELFKRMFKREEKNTIKTENHNKKEEVKIKQDRNIERNTKSRRI